ncbi:hypothetical protein B0H14DRAFT_2902359 [Mycena olivaceomarginata]|nr:hypothetical protein B0H14DRAFT_2902359 [Mycena olivaceomarginata]
MRLSSPISGKCLSFFLLQTITTMGTIALSGNLAPSRAMRLSSSISGKCPSFLFRRPTCSLLRQLQQWRSDGGSAPPLARSWRYDFASLRFGRPGLGPRTAPLSLFLVTTPLSMDKTQMRTVLSSRQHSMSSMSSRSHSSHRTSKHAKTSPAVFCPHCEPCPTCGNGPQTGEAASTTPVDPGPAAPVPTPRASDRERILPAIPISLLFTLFLLEAHMQGGWRHPPHPLHFSNASSQQPPLPMDELSDLIIGLSLTDPGPNVRQQPSKLFSTRDEESIRAVLGSPKYPGINSVKRNKDLLLEVRERVQTARESLLGIDPSYLPTTTTTTQCASLLMPPPKSSSLRGCILKTVILRRERDWLN